MEDDLQLMTTQEKEMTLTAKQKGSTTFAQAWDSFHMPTSADRLIVEMRRWFLIHAPSGEEWFSFPNATQREGQALLKTRAFGHTENCRACAKALERAKYVQLLGQAAGVMSSVAVAVAPDVSQKLLGLAPTLASVFVFLLSTKVRQSLE